MAGPYGRSVRALARYAVLSLIALPCMVLGLAALWTAVARAAESPRWSTFSSEDKMTEEVSHFATSPSVGPERPMDFPYHDVEAWLGVGCQGKDEWAYLGFTAGPNLTNDETEDGYDLIRTRARWDTKVETITLRQDWGSRFLHFYDDTGSVIAKIIRSRSLLVELYWYGQGRVYFHFPLSGSGAAIQEIRKACGASLAEPSGRRESLAPVSALDIRVLSWTSMECIQDKGTNPTRTQCADDPAYTYLRLKLEVTNRTPKTRELNGYLDEFAYVDAGERYGWLRPVSLPGWVPALEFTYEPRQSRVGYLYFEVPHSILPPTGTLLFEGSLHSGAEGQVSSVTLAGVPREK